MKNGILLIDKPKGITSYDVIRKLKKIFKTTKIGHSGTLDPFATGLLIIAIGKATRVLQYLTSEDKIYECEMELGTITDSFDITGKIIEKRDFSHVNKENFQNTLNQFKGEILQVPPVFSAKKMNGERLYEKARRGEIINIPPSKVTVYSIEITDFNLPTIKIITKVSKGTYIRSLVHDIGIKLGCGAVATNLRRLSIGKFDVKNAIQLDKVDANTKLKSIDEVLDFPSVFIKKEFIYYIFNGQSPKISHIKSYENFKKGEFIKILSEDRKFLAIGIAKRNSTFLEKMDRLHPDQAAIKIKKVFKEI